MAIDPVDRTVGLNLRALRLTAGMSQERLAAALGVTFQQIQKYEKGANRIASSRLIAAAGALGCGLADLFAGTGADAIAETGATGAAGLPRDPQVLRLAARLDALPRAQRGPLITAFRVAVDTVEAAGTAAAAGAPHPTDIDTTPRCGAPPLSH
ncbi:helix-turn-helix domain-containing protein [Aurantimonas sp. MSK8Z-1]|uniref:helix-turn-helix domain-containing protein n=1 Tax=Mangrovibrevibacter kandeliae TaxID=2968473 RepID=UPI002117CC69|nr:helix-turn-helix transcriptional regulator [Aurantimonas sp. MSK8Z-1]MCW4114774.1 helix-turn-helix domain-containing protein [Aurantimonas sp. MSK8Z-1]